MGRDISINKVSKPLKEEFQNPKDFLESIKSKDDLSVSIYTQLCSLYKY